MFFSHLPARVEASASGICRASDSISVIGVLGGGDRIAERRVHHDDAARRGRRDVDVVDADAGAADDLQAFRLFQHLRGDLGRGADCEPVEAVDRLGKLVLVLAEIGLEVDLDAAILEDLRRRRAKVRRR